MVCNPEAHRLFNNRVGDKVAIDTYFVCDLDSEADESTWEHKLALVVEQNKKLTAKVIVVPPGSPPPAKCSVLG